MGIFVAHKAVKLMNKKGKILSTRVVNFIGITFKENCPDIRNSKVPDIYNELKRLGIKPYVYDPFADSNQVNKCFGINLISEIKQYDVVILAVSHEEFLKSLFRFIKK